MGGSTTTLTLEQVSSVSWGFGALAIALTAGRYLIRWRVIGRFHLDDAAHFAAMVFMIAGLACYTEQIPGAYAIFAWESGETAPDAGLFDSIEVLSLAVHILFYCTIWSVKLSFLLFYRQLFKISRPFAIAWWAVLAYNLATFAVCIAGTLLQCGGKPMYLADYTICESEISEQWDLITVYFSCAAILSSDLATMVLPIAMLRSLQMRRSQKFAIGFLFSLSLLSVAFDILRLAKTISGGDELDILWYQLEEIIAVIVSAMPSYYSLITWSKLRSTRDRSTEASARALRAETKSSRLHSTRTSSPNGSSDAKDRSYEIYGDVASQV